MHSSPVQSRVSLLALGLLVALAIPIRPARATIAIATVPVGNAGNAGQVQSQGTFGAVGAGYSIGTFEVTNAQYAAFLNAVAATDTFALYNAGMGTNARGGITQSGASELHVCGKDGHGQQTGELRLLVRRGAVHQLAA